MGLVDGAWNGVGETPNTLNGCDSSAETWQAQLESGIALMSTVIVPMTGSEKM